jgi:hypothetical protein
MSLTYSHKKKSSVLCKESEVVTGFGLSGLSSNLENSHQSNFKLPSPSVVEHSTLGKLIVGSLPFEGVLFGRICIDVLFSKQKVSMIIMH